MIHRLKEELLIEEGDELTLSTQEFEEQTPEDGYLHLAAFSYEDTPIWRFLVNGVEIKKEIGMPQITKEQCRQFVGDGAKVLLERTLKIGRAHV